jgi:hypothetical protein
MQELITRDDYANYLNSIFITKFDGGITAEMRLVEVTELIERGKMRSFQLIFQAHPDIPLESRIYELKHERLGDLSLSLEPFKKDANQALFQAVFSQLIG